jgi:hypothetical protein
MDSRAPCSASEHALSLTTFASRLAPTDDQHQLAKTLAKQESPCLLADRGALFGLPGAVITELGNTRDLLIDVFSHMTLFFRRRGHLLAHSGNPGDGLTDADQRRLHHLDTLHAFAGHLLATVGR